MCTVFRKAGESYARRAGEALMDGLTCDDALAQHDTRRSELTSAG